jgi:hypothetical protein
MLFLFISLRVLFTSPFVPHFTWRVAHAPREQGSKNVGGNCDDGLCCTIFPFTTATIIAILAHVNEKDHGGTNLCAEKAHAVFKQIEQKRFCLETKSTSSILNEECAECAATQRPQESQHTWSGSERQGHGNRVDRVEQAIALAGQSKDR